MLTNLLSGYSCATIQIGTKGEGKETLVKGSYALILVGGIQPGNVRNLLLSPTNQDNGFIFRFNLVSSSPINPLELRLLPRTTLEAERLRLDVSPYHCLGRVYPG